MNKNLVVAITGRSGSGKSMFSSCYRQKGYTVIDCDEIAAQIHKNEDCKIELVKFFGSDIIIDGEINRQVLAQKAFSSQENLKALTEITHPFIIENILNIINDAFEHGESIVFVDGAVIIGHSFEKHCDKFITVVCETENQLKRLVERDNITQSQAENRIERQTPLEILLNKSDFVVYNNQTKEILENQAEYILRELKK